MITWGNQWLNQWLNRWLPQVITDMVDSDVTTKLRAPLWLLQITWRPRVILVLCEHTHGGVNRTKAVKEACRMKLDKHRLAKLSENNVVIMNYHLNGVVGCAGGWGGLERGGLDGPLGRGVGVQICGSPYGPRPSMESAPASPSYAGSGPDSPISPPRSVLSVFPSSPLSFPPPPVFDFSLRPLYSLWLLS